jgi:FixJ family two-component response regulator
MTISRPLVTVVDDDPGMLKGLARLLNASGYDTELFDSAEAFLNRPAGRKIACLVLDIHLGGTSGIDLRRTLAAAGSNLSVVFMTAIDDEEIEREAVATGCVAFLRKPFPGRLLIEAIGKAAR